MDLLVYSVKKQVVFSYVQGEGMGYILFPSLLFRASALNPLSFSFITFKVGMLSSIVKYLHIAYYVSDICFKLFIGANQQILTTPL